MGRYRNNGVQWIWGVGGGRSQGWVDKSVWGGGTQGVHGWVYGGGGLGVGSFWV